MKKVSTLGLVVAIALLAFVAGSWITWTASGRGKPPEGRKVLYWIDPMHPAYKSDKPGIAPDCGMQLEPVYADEAGQPMIANALKVSDEKQQLIGVKTGEVETRPVQRTIRTVGRVAADEDRLYRVLAATEGIVRKMSEASSSGSLVRKNEVLLTYFARDYLRPQQLYFAALDYLDAAVKGGAAADRLAQVRGQVRVAIDELINFGMSEAQIVDLGKTRKITADIELRSPVSGYVVTRNVSPDQRFDRGAELFTIADIRTVWILIDVFESDSRDLRPGAKVQVSQTYARSRPFEARVSAALPQFDAASRTLKVRLEADNADYSLRPGMFVDAEIPVSLPAAVTVPVDAVVDSGVRKVVYVDRGNGYFEPRPVDTGMRLGDRVEITRGLEPGERIVLSGTFLLDSESRMKAAAMGITTPARDVVCGMDVDQAKARAAGRVATHDGETYFFCSDDCRKKFQADPASYLKAGKAPEAAGHDHMDGAMAPSARRGPAIDLRPVQTPGIAAILGDGVDESQTVRTSITNVPVVLQLGQYSALAEAETAGVMMDAACGTVVLRADAQKAGLTSRYDDVDYFFATAACKAAFDANPKRYALDPADAPKSVAAVYSASHSRDEDIAADITELPSKPGEVPGISQPGTTQATASAPGKAQPAQPTAAPAGTPPAGGAEKPAATPPMDMGTMPAGHKPPAPVAGPDTKTAPPRATEPAPATTRKPASAATIPMPGARAASPKTAAPPPAPAAAKDPVCGMSVDVKTASAGGLKSDYKGTTYYFCSKTCKESFDKEPGKYAGSKKHD